MYQEDEFTLIVVGSILGLAVGYAQAAWDLRSKRADPDYDEKGRRIDALPAEQVTLPPPDIIRPPADIIRPPPIFCVPSHDVVGCKIPRKENSPIF